jgi:hypothetical protein
VFCASNRLSTANFGEVLDQSEDLSQKVAARIVSIQSVGGSIENTLLDFINEHQAEFKLTQPLTSNDIDAIKKRFTEDYAEIKDSPHFDEFMLLDKSNPGLFVEHQGSIAIDFSEFAKSPELNIDSPDFKEMREEYKQLSQTGVIGHKNEHIEASIEVNLDVLDESGLTALLDKLPLKNRLQLLKQMPELQLRLQQRDFLHHVAKGEQQQSEDILKNCPEIAQRLLTTSGQFTDYSGRTFNCTAYEYAYWAKDKHMCRMLESHMDDDTKTYMLERVNEMERIGLAYQQHGVSYQNPHYDMSFVLKNLTLGDFRQLQTLVGQNSVKIQQATAENYQTIPFTATEYEALKKALEQRKPTFIASFFYTWREEALSAKLQFDFHSLITDLDSYVNNYDKWNCHQQQEAWMKVGKAQRDVPAHVAHEYCRRDRSFDLNAYRDAGESRFKEKTLPRVLTFDNHVTNIKSWFPLTSSSSELGFDFGLLGRCPGAGARQSVGSAAESGCDAAARADLAAVSHLDEVRTADLTQSREILEMASQNHGLRLS